MPTITIRVTDPEKADLESAAQREGKNVSDYVRETLALRDVGVSELERIDHNIAALGNAQQAIFTRLERLERMAGL